MPGEDDSEIKEEKHELNPTGTDRIGVNSHIENVESVAVAA
jgi:hypothetical protein